MTEDPAPAEHGAPDTPDAPPTSPYGTKGLEAYLEANRATFTDAALKDAAMAAGWDPVVVEVALGKVETRATVAPLRTRARSIVRYLYIGGFLVLAAGMLVNPAARLYGGLVIGLVVLLMALLIAYAVGSTWVNGKGVSRAMSTGDLFVLLSVPFLFWLVVAGLCVATGLPIPRAA